MMPFERLHHRMSVLSIALVALALGGGPGAALGAAPALPRLPRDMVLRGAEGSPGPVTFSHTTHVDQAKPACTTCHPALFRILKTSAAAPIRHAGMEAGRQCGACHNDKAAFGLDKCTLCHAEPAKASPGR